MSYSLNDASPVTLTQSQLALPFYRTKRDIMTKIGTERRRPASLTRLILSDSPIATRSEHNRDTAP